MKVASEGRSHTPSCNLNHWSTTMASSAPKTRMMDLVQCPLCAQMFTRALIEEHSATCALSSQSSQEEAAAATQEPARSNDDDADLDGSAAHIAPFAPFPSDTHSALSPRWQRFKPLLDSFRERLAGLIDTGKDSTRCRWDECEERIIITMLRL
eukprot:g5286.t1